LAFGICLLLLVASAYGYTSLEEELDAQQRYVVITTTTADDWPLRPILPMPTPTPVMPKVMATPAPLPVRIAIPKIKVNSRIVEVTPQADGSLGTAAYAVAYHKGTGKPGEADNMLLSGHNNFQGQVFKRLSELKAGDLIQVYTADREYRYVVTETAIVRMVGASAEDRRRHFQYLLPTAEPTLTLISCWPYWVYTHRVYVVAKLVP
jgi:sortase A